MRLMLIPPGLDGWERRREILREIAASVPDRPHDYRGVLYLAPNSRTVMTLRVMFLDALRETHGVSGCVPPCFVTLSGFISRGAVSAHHGPVVDALTRRLVIDSIARAEAARHKGHGFDPDILGGAISARMADRLGEVEAAGRFGELDGIEPGRPLAELLHLAGAAYRKWLQRHKLADPFMLKSAYAPSPGDFARFARVVLDGFHDAEPAEFRLMSALKGHPDCLFVTDAPGISSPASGDDGSPYAATARLLGGLGLGGVQDDPDGYAGRVTLGALFTGMPMTGTSSELAKRPVFSGRVSIVKATDEHAEIHFIASHIKRGVLDGGINRLSDVAVFLPSPDGYMRALERVFSDAGIPYRRFGGSPVSESPAVRDAIGLLSLPAANYNYAAVRAVLMSPFFSFRPDVNAAGLISSYARDEGVTCGRDNFLRLASVIDSVTEHSEEGEDRPLDAEAAGALRRLIDLTDRLGTKRRTLPEWVDAARSVLDGCGIADAVDGHSGGFPGLKAAYGSFTMLMDGLRAASGRLGDRMRLNEFISTLRAHSAETAVLPDDEGLDAVRIVDRPRLVSEPFRVVFAAGTMEKSMPASPSPDPLLSERSIIALGIPGRREMQDRDGRAFMSLIHSGAKVYVSCPGEFRSKSATPSRYIRALEPFVEAGDIGYIEYARLGGLSMSIGPSDALRTAVAWSSGRGPESVSEALGAVADYVPPASRIRRRSTDEGGTPGHMPERFSVTELEAYMFCGWRYYQSRVLGLGEMSAPEEDAAPHITGKIVHTVLQRFHGAHPEPVTGRNAKDALKLLTMIAGEEFGRLPVTLRNMETSRRFVTVTGPAFIHSEAEHAGSGFRTLAAERRIRMDMGDGLVLSGKIDRLDITKDGRFEVVDYKTGQYPTKPEDQFQLPVYALMASRDEGLAKEAGVPLRPAAFVYYGLKEGAERCVVVSTPEADEPRSRVTVDDMDGLIADAEERAREAVRGIRAGDFGPTCKNDNFCRKYCEFLKVCEKFTKIRED